MMVKFNWLTNSYANWLVVMAKKKKKEKRKKESELLKGTGGILTSHLSQLNEMWPYKSHNIHSRQN